jgi:phage terminase large subunit GpA-like protein
MEYGEKYFDMLTAEEKIGNKYESYGRRNEALDCRVGALCAGDIFLDEQKIKYRDFIKNQKRFPFKFQGITFNRPQDADLFTERKVIEIIVQQTDPKKLYDHFANFNKNILK